MNRGMRLANRVVSSAVVRGALVARPVTVQIAGRYVGGPDVESAVNRALELQAEGIRSTLHLREVPARADDVVSGNVATYRSVIEKLAASEVGRGSDISIKMEQLGLNTPSGLQLIRESLAGLVEYAYANGVQVTMDMERRDEVSSTLAVVGALRPRFPGIGVAVQSCLPRTLDDCLLLARDSARVRLCKGGYEPPSRRAQRHQTDVNFVRCLRVLMAGDGYPMVATHDPRLIRLTQELARRSGRGPQDFEFQMLLGVRDVELRRLAREGYAVRAYVAFGPEWYTWFTRRVAERPANLTLVARSILSGNGVGQR